jgi:PIN domain nuclease of toxin-antitoxin system
MNLLLDTHAVVWWLQDSPKLGKRARKAIFQHGANAFISSISIWEISVKHGAKRLKLKEPLEEYLPLLEANGFQPLSVNFEHALAVQHLPALHADPFDRMLIAQAQCEDLAIVTADSAIEGYNVRTLDASE